MQFLYKFIRFFANSNRSVPHLLRPFSIPLARLCNLSSVTPQCPETATVPNFRVQVQLYEIKIDINFRVDVPVYSGISRRNGFSLVIPRVGNKQGNDATGSSIMLSSDIM